MTSTVYFVVPCYNEQEVLPETSKRLLNKLNQLIAQNKCTDKSRIMFVDDGSKDTTWQIISNLNKSDRHFAGVKLSRNRGHQNALLAGLMTAMPICDCAISLDADLQDDIDAIDQFIDKFHEGCDVVYGVRRQRTTDTAFKRTTAQGFYKVMAMMGVDIVYNHADYRLMSRRALEGLSQYKEVNLFLRGIVPLIGYKSSEVYYDRAERFAGESKYPLKKMLNFAFDGITSFSVKPIRFITGLGAVFAVLSAIALVVSLLFAIFSLSFAGWVALVAAIWLMGGIQLMALGLVGEYIGKIYGEVKARPHFIIESILNDTDNN